MYIVELCILSRNRQLGPNWLLQQEVRPSPFVIMVNKTGVLRHYGIVPKPKQSISENWYWWEVRRSSAMFVSTKPDGFFFYKKSGQFPAVFVATKADIFDQKSRHTQLSLWWWNRLFFKPEVRTSPVVLVANRVVYVWWDFWTISCCVCDNQNRYFKPNHDVFHCEVFFTPIPNQNISTMLWQNRKLEFNHYRHKAEGGETKLSYSLLFYCFSVSSFE